MALRSPSLSIWLLKAGVGSAAKKRLVAASGKSNALLAPPVGG